MRKSISAQSLASVPPSRALIVSNAGFASNGPLNRAFVSNSSSDCVQPIEFRRHFRREAVVLAGHLDQRGQILRRTEHFLQRLEHRLERFQLADDLAGLLLIVPEIGGGHPLLDRGRLPCLGGVVKESLVVGESAAEWPRPDRSIRVP